MSPSILALGSRCQLKDRASGGRNETRQFAFSLMLSWRGSCDELGDLRCKGLARRKPGDRLHQVLESPNGAANQQLRRTVVKATGLAARRLRLGLPSGRRPNL